MAKQIHAHNHSDYVKGESWKCRKSPTGAHHWIIQRQTICKYCKLEKPSLEPLPEAGISTLPPAK